MEDDANRRKRIHGMIVGIGDFSPDPDVMAAAMVDFGPGFDEFFKISVDLARETKQDVVVNGPEDLPVLATVVTDAGSMTLPVQEMCDGLDMRPPEALAINMQITRQAMGIPIAVMVLMETVYRKVESEQEAEAQLESLGSEPGALAQRWYNGESGINEALVMTIATRDRYVSEFMPYHYGDGSVVWDEGSRNETEGWPDVEMHERVGEAIQFAFRQEGGTDGDGAQ
jgi:hypothetical protein